MQPECRKIKLLGGHETWAIEYAATAEHERHQKHMTPFGEMPAAVPYLSSKPHAARALLLRFEDPNYSQSFMEAVWAEISKHMKHWEIDVTTRAQNRGPDNVDSIVIQERNDWLQQYVNGDVSRILGIAGLGRGLATGYLDTGDCYIFSGVSNDPVILGIAGAHEPGHLYGRMHQLDRRAIMQPVVNRENQEWTPADLAELDRVLIGDHPLPFGAQVLLAIGGATHILSGYYSSTTALMPEADDVAASPIYLALSRQGKVNIYLRTNIRNPVHSFEPYPGWTGSIELAFDANQNLVTGPTAGAPHIKVWQSKSWALMAHFMAFKPYSRHGVRIACGKFPDNAIVVGTGEHATSHVRVFNTQGQLNAEWLAYDPAYAVGAAVAVYGQDIITVPASGSAHCRRWSAAGKPIASFAVNEGEATGKLGARGCDIDAGLPLQWDALGSLAQPSTLFAGLTSPTEFGNPPYEAYSTIVHNAADNKRKGVLLPQGLLLKAKRKPRVAIIP